MRLHKLRAGDVKSIELVIPRENKNYKQFVS